jgi:hypothetical protein
MRVKIAAVILLLLCSGAMQTGCSQRQDAYNNGKMKDVSEIKTESDIDAANSDSETESVEAETVNPNAVIKASSTYDCDIKADREAYDGYVDITVGDRFFATQINDWYMYFEQYVGKVVVIEGYYIGDFAPYDFIGRYGPSCPYCQGGYVCFEIFTDEDVSNLESAKDWIKVTGILRQGMDSEQGPFYYIEALELEKMDQVGVDTVTN